MKQSDGLFHRIFDEIAAEYPQIQNEHWIVDIGAAKLADTPEAFDVIVMPNLYGDILSDVAAQIAGSVGLAGSANIGTGAAMFEAIHGSAPRRAGQNLANPSGLLHGAILMLVHIDQHDVAERVHNAWLRTIEDGIHTYDIYDERVSRQKVGTKEFAQAVVDRVGKKPEKLKPAVYGAATKRAAAVATATAAAPRKDMVGLDVFVDWVPGAAADLGRRLQALAGPEFALTMVSNRGVKVFPDGFEETFLSDSWRCRFHSAAGRDRQVTHFQVVALLTRIASAGIDFVKTESLCLFNGERAYSLDQGE
jgi:isocitrate dehydrogenase